MNNLQKAGKLDTYYETFWEDFDVHGTIAIGKRLGSKWVCKWELVR